VLVRSRRVAGFVVLLAIGACGTRTDLSIDAPALDASADVQALDARADASADSGADVVEDVIIVTDAGCTNDADCQDGVACTLDRCDPMLRVCTHAPRNALCDDGVFCNGDERCDANLGCASGVRNCADAISCTKDSCDEGKKACVHAPDDMQCPISHACDPQLGCQARALAEDDTTLYDVRLPSGQVKAIGPVGLSLSDIALHPSNVLYGLTFSALYTIDQMTAKATFAKSLSANSLNGLDAAPNGALYASGGGSLSLIDPQTGSITFVASFPNGRSSSGDLAFVGARLLASAIGGMTDELVEFDLANKTSKIVGPIGFGCVWGLAAYGMILYGLTCQGLVLSIDTNTGKGTQLNTANVTFRGASAR
jgi:hypothetical protein